MDAKSRDLALFSFLEMPASVLARVDEVIE